MAGGFSQSAVNDKAGARHAPGTRLCLDYACALPALSHRPAREPSKGGSGRRRVDRGVRPAGLSGTAAMWRVSRLDFYAATIALLTVGDDGPTPVRPMLGRSEGSIMYNTRHEYVS
jgi:hypothetical protein